jgi:hypothetical protein
MYAVAKKGSASPVFRVTVDGVAVEIGNIDTSSSGPVQIVNNPTQLCFVDGVWGYVYTLDSGEFKKIDSEDFPGAGGVAFQDGYGLFFQPDTTSWFFSAIDDFTTFDATHAYYQRAHNDNILGMISFKQQLWIFGSKAYEVWYDYGGDDSTVTNPTWSRYKDGVIKSGLGAKNTLNDTDGATVSWLSDKNTVNIAVAQSPMAMNNQMFSRALESMPTVTDATSFSYTDKGHVFVQYNFTSGDQTWVFDATTKLFHKKQSRKADQSFGRHIADCHTYLNNKHYVGGYNDGSIYEMNQDYYDDNGKPIRRELHTIDVDTGIFPVRHRPFSLLFDGGVGLEDGLDPQVMMQYSNDGAHTFSYELWRSAGLMGDYKRKAIWWRTGSSSRRLYKLAMTDPVLWRIYGIDTGEKQNAVS